MKEALCDIATGFCYGIGLILAEALMRKLGLGLFH